MRTESNAGKTIMVTGGTGSFGHAIVKELLKGDTKEIIVLSRDEEKQLDMYREFHDGRLNFVLGDVRDYDRILDTSKDVQTLYHAAAQKIISSCEEAPLEAVRTNVEGTWNVKRAAIKNEIERAIFVSTDKAVKPVNLYGMTKGIAEKIWVANEISSRTKFSAVRYGNVIGSRGSVVPFFKKLIQEKEPLPITDVEMTRFLITLKQAIELVLYTTEHMKGGEIFVPNLPACNMLDLAKAMAGEAYPLRIVGLREGEKVHECLINEYEINCTASVGQYFIIHPGSLLNHKDLAQEFTSDKTSRLKKKEILALLKEAGWA
ncbi:MAG: SDR family NAD(P)-dependent oxidoreductase [Candidatus Bathyarchaeia archaeon]